ncbi:LOW QUALITY PROTEIN: hypothetical protein Cgig2_010417 [Carnegiea gigantea]|uniref:Uncharacterized protein n=1 Tax=Carnegiea gigantea TaxID=171969 RepID=A0A9Q1GUQ9_9CARY|nr:LOW QUALITY PROTEIN: hypothetical protein Cgig2_010417 [Carnegiea gigantea]
MSGWKSLDYEKIQLCPSLEFADVTLICRIPEKAPILSTGCYDAIEDRARERDVGVEFGAGKLGGASIVADIGKEKAVASAESVEEVGWTLIVVGNYTTSNQGIVCLVVSWISQATEYAIHGGILVKCGLQPEPEDELQTRQKTAKGQKRVVSNDGEINKLSPGTEYEPHIKEEGVSDSDLSVESEYTVDEKSTQRIRGGEGIHLQGKRDVVEGNIGVGVEPQSPQGRISVAVLEDSDVVLQSQCTIKKLVTLNAEMTAQQREVVKATALCLFMEYLDIAMERHLMLMLIKCWAFNVGGKGVPLSIFEVALLTGLPATKRTIELAKENVRTNVGHMVGRGTKGGSFVDMCLLWWRYAMRAMGKIELGFR